MKKCSKLCVLLCMLFLLTVRKVQDTWALMHMSGACIDMFDICCFSRCAMRGLTTSCVDCRLFAMVVVAYVITLKGMVKQWFMTTVDIGMAVVLIGIFHGVGH